MNKIGFILCKKPVVGVLMWLSSMCATNQAIRDGYIDLGTANVLMSQKVKTPMDEKYSLLMSLKPTEPNDVTTPLPNNWGAILCGAVTRSDKAGQATNNNELASYISLTVEIFALNGQLISRNIFSPTCPRPKYEDAYVLILGYIEMTRGKYYIKITNNHPISYPGTRKVQVIFRGRSAGYP
jgi:hypothetical protein